MENQEFEFVRFTPETAPLIAILNQIKQEYKLCPDKGTKEALDKKIMIRELIEIINESM